MLLEFVPNSGFNFLSSFSEKFNVPFEGTTLIIPASMGEGSIRIIDLSPDFKLLIHRYRLNEDFTLKRIGSPILNDLVSIIFNSNEEPVKLLAKESQIQFSKNSEFAVQISSTDLDSEIRFPANKEIYFTVIGISAPRLSKFLDIKHPNSVVQTILNGSDGYLFYESMTPDVQKTLKQLTEARNGMELNSFYYRIKVQELIYFLFEKLLKRDSSPHSPLNKADADRLLVVRTAVLADLGKQPSLPQLAQMAGFSETKLKSIFKQVFGDSIYNHYQKARMEEAAFLLKQGAYSVSEVGYELGFSNLSHFSRLFEKHHGIKPKKYSTA